MELTEKYLESLGIYDLRNLARILNVKRPTTKIKSELIEEILKNKDNYVYKNNRKGRPPKSNIFSEKQMNLIFFEENLKKVAVELDKNFFEYQKILIKLKEDYYQNLREHIQKFYYEIIKYFNSKEMAVEILSEELESLRENSF